RAVELPTNFPLAAVDLSTVAPSDPAAIMVVSPANGLKRHVYIGPFDTWQRARRRVGISRRGPTRVASPLGGLRARPPAESRSRGVRARSDDALAERDRRGQRDRRRRRLLPRVACQDLPSRPCPLREG